MLLILYSQLQNNCMSHPYQGKKKKKKRKKGKKKKKDPAVFTCLFVLFFEILKNKHHYDPGNIENCNIEISEWLIEFNPRLPTQVVVYLQVDTYEDYPISMYTENTKQGKQALWTDSK